MKIEKKSGISPVATWLRVGRLFCSSRSFLRFTEEFMHVLKGSDEDDNSGAYDAHKEHDFEQPHAEQSEEHRKQCNADSLGDGNARRPLSC